MIVINGCMICWVFMVFDGFGWRLMVFIVLDGFNGFDGFDG